MKKNPLVIWVCADSEKYFRSSGEVRSRLNSVLSKLSDKGYTVHIIIPYNPDLLPKTKVSDSRVSTHSIQLNKAYEVEFFRLSRSTAPSIISMMKIPPLESPLSHAIFAKAAISYAKRLKKPIDLFHIQGWQGSLLPYFLETDTPQSSFLQRTKTLLSINPSFEDGNFSSDTLDELGIPRELFHYEALEYYGRVNIIKAGVLFSDHISVVTSRGNSTNGSTQNFLQLLQSQSNKVRYWPSQRNAKSYLDTYKDIIIPFSSKPKVRPLLEKLRSNYPSEEEIIERWGPQLPSRYDINTLVLLPQSPTKAFCYWEFNNHEKLTLGLSLNNISQQTNMLLSKNINSLGEFWLEVEPDQEYSIDLVTWSQYGERKVLLSSNVIRTARIKPSKNTNAIFIDVRNKKRVHVDVDPNFGKTTTFFNYNSMTHVQEKQRLTPFIPSESSSSRFLKSEK